MQFQTEPLFDIKTNEDVTSHKGNGQIVLYVLQNALSDRDRDRFGMNYFLARGYAVRAIDIADLIYTNFKYDREHYAKLTDIDMKVVSESSELLGLIPFVKEARFIFFIAQSFGPSRENLAALRLVTRSGRPYVIFSIDARPLASPEPIVVPLRTRLISLFRRIELLSPMNSLISRLPLSVLGIRAADFVIYDGTHSVQRNRLVTNTTSPIFAHSFDFESARTPNQDLDLSKNSAVFIDQFIPFNHDFLIIGNANQVTSEDYHVLLRRLFDRIENEFSLEVVIAAHPKANYDEAPDLFGGRRLFRNSTSDLIRKAQLVITHHSTAANFAIIHRKPILVVSTHQLHSLNPTFAGQIDGLSKWTGTQTVFLDTLENVNLSNIMHVEDDAYDKFAEAFLKIPTSPNRPFWEIVLNAIGDAARRPNGGTLNLSNQIIHDSSQ